MKFFTLPVALLLANIFNPSRAFSEDVTDLVDPLIGTIGTGHVFPGPCRPFGLVQPSPDTGNGSWKYCSGYCGEDREIRRFSQTHLNGTGRGSLGDVGILPFSADATNDPRTVTLKFSKEQERATLGKYEVTAEDGTRVEIASGLRVAHYRITFAPNRTGRLVLDFPYGLYSSAHHKKLLTRSCSVEHPTGTTFEGFNHSDVWGPRDIGYVLELSAIPTSCRRLDSPGTDLGPQYLLTFAPDTTLEVRIAISANSIEGARKNFAAERETDFDSRVAETKALWIPYLRKLDLDGRDTDLRKGLVTAMYHLCQQPNLISDVDQTPRYSTFSLWDTFRDAHPLYEQLVPEMVPAFINSLLAHYRQWGYLPRWELWGRETNCMIGSHAVPVVADAIEHGFKGFDVEEAYAAIKATLTKEERPGAGVTSAVRTDWGIYDKYGYYPFDLIGWENVSRTLECSYDDFRAARLARRLGRTADADFFEKRSWNFTNLWDAASLTFRGKDSKGSWYDPCDPANCASSHNYTEGTPLQYSWYVMHRPEWLITAMGGREAFEQRLDAYFAGTLFPGVERNYVQDITGLIGDYAHGNEPSHHVTSFYRLLGKPEKAEALERKIIERFYKPLPDGLCGNDDCGQMSAWLIRTVYGLKTVTSSLR